MQHTSRLLYTSVCVFLFFLLWDTKGKEHCAYLAEAEHCLPEDQIIVRSSADTLSCQRDTADFRWEGLQRGTLPCAQLNKRWGRSLWCNSGVHCATLIPFAEGIVSREAGGVEGAAALQVRPTPRAYHYFRLSVAQQEEGEESCKESQPDGGAPGSHSRSIPNVSRRQLVPPARPLFPNNSAHASAGSNFKWQLVIQESDC